MTGAVTVLSSMATRGLLAELLARWVGPAELTAIGGVEAARTVRAGTRFDVAVLAEAALAALEYEGLLRPGSRRGVASSSIAVAVRQDDAPPDLSTVAAMQAALRQAGRIGYSTGPSGDHLLALLSGWGLREALGGRLVQAPPGMPVGRLLADGAVDLAVQQRSELIGIDGIVLAGELPEGAQRETVFAAAVLTASGRADDASRLVSFLAEAHNDLKRRHGLQPA